MFYQMLRIFLFMFLIPAIADCQTNSYHQPIVDTSVNLYAFVGEKISIVEFDPNAEFRKANPPEIDSLTGDTISIKMRILMDNALIAKYRVIHEVFNRLSVDTIEFEVYDHWGRPSFEQYKTVLLYISRSEDGKRYIHQKYQFDRLKKTGANTWIGTNNSSLISLFNKKKDTVFKARGLF